MSDRDMEELLALVEKNLGASWLDIVEWLREHNALDDIDARLAAGDPEGVVAMVQEAAEKYAGDIRAEYVRSGQTEAAWIDSQVPGAVIRFDVENERAIAWANRNRLELVSNLSHEQADVVRTVITDGVQRGANPREVARDIRDSIGLAPSQAQAVNNYRRALEAGDFSNALGRELTNGNDDRAVAAAMRNGTALSQDRIDAMVERYRQNFIGYRAEVIARTEGLRAVHQGTEELYRQAVDAGDVEADALTRTWHSAHDARVRSSHRAMDGQQRKLGDAFVSGDGVDLQYPGDPAAPPGETVQCRCVISTRFDG